MEARLSCFRDPLVSGGWHGGCVQRAGHESGTANVPASVVASRSAYKDAPAQGIVFDDLAMEREYSDALAYGQSKLANVLFSLKLAPATRHRVVT